MLVRFGSQGIRNGIITHRVTSYSHATARMDVAVQSNPGRLASLFNDVADQLGHPMLGAYFSGTFRIRNVGGGFSETMFLELTRRLSRVSRRICTHSTLTPKTVRLQDAPLSATAKKRTGKSMFAALR